MKPTIIEVDGQGYRTPASDYPRTKGKTRIGKTIYDGGYASYGVRGATYMALDKVTVTTLVIDGKTWMVDDPWHWWLIEDIAAQMRGDVFVGGLGLGLIVHALFRNENVDSVTVVERSRAVIALVGPEVDGMCRIIEGDVYEYLHRTDYACDTAFVDLWVTNSKEETRNTLYSEVLPLAVNFALRNKLMWALGFTGAKPVVEALGWEPALEAIREREPIRTSPVSIGQPCTPEGQQ